MNTRVTMLTLRSHAEREITIVLAEAAHTNTSIVSIRLCGGGRDAWHRGDTDAINVIAQALTQNTIITSLNFKRNFVCDEGAALISAALKTNASVCSLSLQSLPVAMYSNVA